MTPLAIAFFGLAGGLAALVLSLTFCTIFQKAAPALGLIDRPKNEAHKNHAKATPVAGGAAMLCSWLLTMLCGVGCLFLLSLTPLVSRFPVIPGILIGLKSASTLMLVIIGCAALLAAVGLKDDSKPMKAGRKFLFQFLVAAATATFGPHVSLCCPLPLVTWLLTVLWIVTVINAINFFDNMDGLAGGVSAIASLFFFIIATLRGQYLVAAVAAVTCGSALGFLWNNKPPAKIFMGDGGSHFIGYVLAILSILTTFYLPSDSPTALPLLIPLFVLALPLFDALTVVCIRLKLHKPIYLGDNRHLSHRFVMLGLTRPQAVLVILLLSFVTGASALTLLWLPVGGAILVFFQNAAVFSVITLIQFFVKKVE